MALLLTFWGADRMCEAAAVAAAATTYYYHTMGTWQKAKNGGIKSVDNMVGLSGF